MTVSSMAAKIGKQGVLTVEKMNIDVVIDDAKANYGRVLLLVRPAQGSGSQWVDESRVTL